MIFTTLCVTMYSGGEDCSYSYIAVPEHQLLSIHAYLNGYDGVYSEDGSKSLIGFVYPYNKNVYVLEGVHESHVNHEKKHVICGLEYERHGTNHPQCKGHFRV